MVFNKALPGFTPEYRGFSAVSSAAVHCGDKSFQGEIEGTAQNLPGLPLGWMRQIIDKPTPRKPLQQPSGCIGSFWDAKLRKIVKIDLGLVLARPVLRFIPEDEPHNVLAWSAAFESGQYPTNSKGLSTVRVLCNTRTNANGLQSPQNPHP